MKTNAGPISAARGIKPGVGLAIVFATGLLLGSCSSADDVEINLPLVGDIMKKSKPTEEKMASRGTLVLPPKADALPEPVDEKAQPNGNGGVESWPVDADLKAKQEKEVTLAKKKQIEREGDWKNEQSSGNGLEDFNKKTRWSERQTGIFDKLWSQEE